MAFHILNAIEFKNDVIVKFLLKFVTNYTQAIEKAIVIDNVSILKLFVSKFKPDEVLFSALTNDKHNISAYPLLRQIYLMKRSREILTSTNIKKLEKYAVTAASRGYFELVNFLISRGCKNYNTMMETSVGSSNDVRIIKLLLAKGVDPEEGLLFACYNERLDLVKLMLKKGARNYDEIYKYITDWSYTHK